MAGILRTDTIQNSNTSTIITQTNSTTITIGTTGQTVALASGATSSGFGATYNGAVNWDTTPKTTTVTAASGVGYFINTTSGAVTVNLPAGTAGAIVALSDYAGTWNTNNVTVNANGTDKIGGVSSAPVTLSTRGQAVTFVYVDSTRGWINTGDATYIAGNAFVSATGGTITTCGDYKIHTFTGPGTFTVTNGGAPSGSNSVDYLVVAGGGGSFGNDRVAGGAGAGGYRESKATGAPWTASPLATSTSLPVSATAYPITVGGGGSGAANPGASGGDSIFSTITSAGGGGAGYYSSTTGGSGGGGGSGGATPGAAGNTPPVSPPQGNPGGNGFTAFYNPTSGAGGGGATSAGSNGSNPAAGPGGNGATTSISGSPVTYAGGGGGGGQNSSGGTGGPGGGGNGAGNGIGSPGTTNTGGGGGGNGGTGPEGGGRPGAGGNGGSGIVVIRYKFQ
jgi:hypothetical protein